MSISFIEEASGNDPSIESNTNCLFRQELSPSLRPRCFKHFVGQKEAVTCLETYCKAAKNRNEPLDHVLLSGRPGLGKTTLAGIIAYEMNSNMRITSGPAIEKSGELIALLTNLSEGDILFIDDIHRLNRHLFEVLFPAMEDCCADIIIGKGPSANSIHLDLPHFTLICATYRADCLSVAFRNRFGIQIELRPYTAEELKEAIQYFCKILELQIDEKSIALISEAGNGTPRELLKILNRVNDFAQLYEKGTITADLTEKALDLMEATGLKRRRNCNFSTHNSSISE